MLVEYSPQTQQIPNGYDVRRFYPFSSNVDIPTASAGESTKRVGATPFSFATVVTPLVTASPQTATHKVSGLVLSQESTPISRKVAAFSRTTLNLLGEALSDPVTGEYTIQLATNEPCFVVCLPEANESINAKIFDKVIPDAI